MAQKKLNVYPIVFTALGIALLVVSGVALGLWSRHALRTKNNWQAVFLTSGQVYYGKLEKAEGQFYRLRDVYYLRQTPSSQEGKPPEVNLVKMGNEIHGPENVIYLNRDHILYVEDLRDDGQVVKAIGVVGQKGTTQAVSTGAQPSPVQPSLPESPSAAGQEPFGKLPKALGEEKQSQPTPTPHVPEKKGKK